MDKQQGPRVSTGNYSQCIVINYNGKERETEYLYLNHFAVCCCVFTLCDPGDCSRSGSCVLHYLLEFAQIHVH